MAQRSRLQLVSLLVFVGSFQVDVTTACGGEERASYRLEFQGLWSERSFPKSYPKYRKSAQWSTLIGLSHNDRYTMWEPGQLVSQPFKDFAEGEDPSGKQMQSEMVKLQNGSVFAAKSIGSGTGRSTTTVFAHRDYTKISFAVRLIPSPDWFVGVSGLDLCEGGSWRKDPLQLELQPWDAGTDGGFSFTSPDYVTNPQEPITQITSQRPNHPANSFFYPKLDALPPIARVTLVWQPVGDDNSAWMDKLVPVATGLDKAGEDVQMPGDSPEYVFPGIDLPTEPETVIPYDCEVTPWGSWSPCDTLCKVGLRRRFRLVIQPPKNGGRDCPDLIAVEACQAKLTKPQKRCSKARIKKEIKKYMKIQRRNYMGKKKRNRFIV
ncbi:spondin-2-like [Acanthaster planci]|uniref:Spondin-2-like n=1 Tax=Acanthaster planci TaxID=133434 RepID=A0A8B7YJT9_ACAPL|nr:spondin-2-like [Acanthaster planci]XP_022091831.1 spondin-2-like [Acanthaster planci]